MSLLTKDAGANSTSNQSMHFWGICFESGKQYAQVVDQRFRITMAVLDPKSSPKDGEKTVSLRVRRAGMEYLLCVLKHDEIYQVNLNLIFDKGENVSFYIDGYGKVCVSGYQMTDSDSDALNDENGYLCPIVEVTPPESKPQKRGKYSKTPQSSSPESVTPKSKKKLEAEVDKSEDLAASDKKKKVDKDRYSTEEKSSSHYFDGFGSYKEEDEDYFIQSNEKDEDDREEEEEEESDEDEDDFDEEESTSEDEDEEEIYSRMSQRKRKLANMPQPEKRTKYDSISSTPNAARKSECLEDNGLKDTWHPDALNSSIGNTPMPKKKSKKKKKGLNEISVNSQESPDAESTPNRSSNAVQKLEGGVEIQDIIVGKGPEAKVGKMVHVFYVGRFLNKKIFDSRLAGKKPFSFKLGAHHVIKGWEVGMKGMRVGGRRRLKVPPNMGYGSTAMGNVPPNSTLNFIIELLAVS